MFYAGTRLGNRRHTAEADAQNGHKWQADFHCLSERVELTCNFQNVVRWSVRVSVKCLWARLRLAHAANLGADQKCPLYEAARLTQS
eukprot:5439369-Pleurochrysis_carterae.AAC.2